MGWGSAIGGALGAVGSIFGASSSSSSAKAATERQIAWERERAKNAHQWEIEDLKKAGINPVLTAGGSGATTSGITAAMPDTSGYTSAGQILSDVGMKMAKEYADIKGTDTAADVGESQTAKNLAEAANEAAKNPYVAEREKAEISNLASKKTNQDLENQYLKDTYQSRLTKQFAETEKEVSEGRISIDNAKFLEKYGITREEAIKLGAEGIKQIGDMIKLGMGGKMLDDAKKSIIKDRTKKINSAKRGKR